MDIERVNENTLKFYISYMDIEDRGFDREEIWYNREKSEQLFWDMMDEVHDQEDFSIEGPLWIQVQALDNGLEIVVTRAQISKDGQKLELPTEDGKTVDMPVDEKIESLLEQKFNVKQDDQEGNDENDKDADDDIIIDSDLSFVIRLNDFEDAIQLSYYFNNEQLIENALFHYDSNYYLFVIFEDEEMTDDEQEDILSQLLEYGHESAVTVHRLEEYGKVIFNENALTNIRNFFPQE